MSRHRAPVRPRYGRVVLAAGAAAVTGVSVLGGMGVVGAGSGAATAGASSSGFRAAPPASAPPAPPGPPATSGAAPAGAASREPTRVVRAGTVLERHRRPWQPRDRTLPDASGEGRRVVFSESRQQVWLVGAGGRVARTYLVSGSTYDNLDPGTYQVYSRSEDAVGIDDSGTMKYFVRFTRGANAAIGFHDIPVDEGARVQTFDQLGTPLSHGCIRQRRRDAVALWDFAPLGTTVVVTA